MSRLGLRWLASRRDTCWTRAFPATDPLQLCIAGHTGQVGHALLVHLQEKGLNRDSVRNWQVAALVNSRLVQWPETSAPPEQREPGDWARIIARFKRHPGPKLFIDCSASESVAAQYPVLLGHHIPIVTPNKLAFSASQRVYTTLQRLGRENGAGLYYETTVGASLPILSTVRDLLSSGDQITRIEACLSGTWSYVLNRLQSGIAFSQAVREAQERGYAEPNPVHDFSGSDVRRKLLILLREIGLELEPSDVAGENPFPESTQAGNRPDNFMPWPTDWDALWSERALEAASQGQRLVFRACFDGRQGRVALARVPVGSMLAELAPGENRICFWTRRYSMIPLSVAGPGAGPELTAAGVLLDVIKAEAAQHRGAHLVQPGS